MKGKGQYMSKKFINKNIKLSMELDEYLLSNPEKFDAIPSGAYLVITTSEDPEFSKASLDIAQKSRSRRKFIEAKKTSRGWLLRPLTLSYSR